MSNMRNEDLTEERISQLSAEQLLSTDVRRMDPRLLRRLAIEAEVKGYFGFISRSQRRAEAANRPSSAHNIFERDRRTGLEYTVDEQLAKARASVGATFDRCGSVPNAVYADLVLQKHASRRGLLLAGRVELNPSLGFVLQTVDVAVNQRSSGPIPEQMEHILGKAGVAPSNRRCLRLMMITREDAPDVLAFPGGMIPSPEVEAQLGCGDVLLERDPVAATFRDEVRQEIGIDVSVEPRGDRPERFGLDVATPIAHFLAFGTRAGYRRTTLGVVRDETGSQPEAQSGEDAASAGSIPVDSLLQYMSMGGLLSSDELHDGRLVRGKHAIGVILALNKLEADLYGALNSATGYASTRMKLGDGDAIEDMKSDLAELRELRSLRKQLVDTEDMRRACTSNNPMQFMLCTSPDNKAELRL